MLNYETLLSSYDDKLTLMQWLKKVEEALKDASAVSFNVNKRGDATLSFSVVFEDGSELETAPIILQQGESVQAATIRNGHLILTLTNGDELDAGDLGGVSGFSINASQHLIVTYQNGTTQDLGAIFSGNVVINGNFKVTGLATLPRIEGDENGEISVDGDIVISDGGLSIADGAVSTPVLTSANDQIEAQKPVVEVMTGYSATIGASTSDFDIEPVYISACKNANKITFVAAFNLTRKTENTGALYDLVKFYLPAAVYAKLYPTQIGTYSFLDVRKLEVFANQTASVSINVFAQKETSAPYRNLLMSFVNLQNLPLNNKYYVRYEITLLLNESMI